MLSWKSVYQSTQSIQYSPCEIKPLKLQKSYCFLLHVCSFCVFLINQHNIIFKQRCTAGAKTF